MYSQSTDGVIVDEVVWILNPSLIKINSRISLDESGLVVVVEVDDGVVELLVIPSRDKSAEIRLPVVDIVVVTCGVVEVVSRGGRPKALLRKSIKELPSAIKARLMKIKKNLGNLKKILKNSENLKKKMRKIWKFKFKKLTTWKTSFLEESREDTELMIWSEYKDDCKFLKTAVCLIISLENEFSVVKFV